MTTDDFAAAAIAVLRSAIGWQTRIAARLGVDPRTVRRWLKNGVIPSWVDARFAEWIGASAGPALPRDEWIVGDAVHGRRREYIVHARAPRFIARVVACDERGLPLPEEEPADILSGVIYSTDDMLLCEVVCIDEVVPGDIVRLMEAAADALSRRSGSTIGPSKGSNETKRTRAGTRRRTSMRPR